MKQTQVCSACGSRWDNSVKYCLDCYHAVLKPIKKRKIRRGERKREVER